MKIRILVIGKTKEQWCSQGEQHYLDRLKPFCQIEKIELPEEKITPSISQEEVKKREGQRILEKISDEFYVMALSPNGKQMSSAQLATKLNEIKDHHGGKLALLIGGPLGLSQQVLQRSDQVLSFSAMTFPHDLFRIMLLEQIYRGFSILAGKKYHK